MSPISLANLFHQLPAALTDEVTDVLVTAPHVRIERIVSHGQCSPPGYWYDQHEHEWVVLLQGEACLRFEQDGRVLHLRPGDHVTIPAHCRHRVESTAADTESVWLAVFY